MTSIDKNGDLHDRDGRYAGTTASAPTSTLTDEQVRAAHATIMAPAIRLTQSYRLDPEVADDIAQDAWLDLVKRSKPLEELVRDEALLKLVSRTVATRQTVGPQHGLRHEDFQARRILREQELEFEREHDRKMTPTEREAAADELRMSLPPKRRPRKDFYVEYSTLSIDAETQAGVDGSTIADTLVASDPTPDEEYNPAEDAAATALYQFEEAGSLGKVAVKRDAWRIIALNNGAPMVARASISVHAASKVRRYFSDQQTDARSLAQRWLDGLSTEADEAALFAPWGSPKDLDMDARDKVAELLVDRPQFAEKLWGEALKEASRR